MKIAFNTGYKHAGEMFESGDEIEVAPEVGHRLVGDGVAGVIELDQPKKREPKSTLKKGSVIKEK